MNEIMFTSSFLGLTINAFLISMKSANEERGSGWLKRLFDQADVNHEKTAVAAAV